MASQDELKQVGLEVDVMVDEAMVEDTTPMQELPPQPSSESVRGAGATYERCLHQTFPSVRGESASLGPSDRPGTRECNGCPAGDGDG